MLFKTLVFFLIALGVIGYFARSWLIDHPEHNPWAPFELDHAHGWATSRKLSVVRNDPVACRAVLQRGGISFTMLPPAGTAQCRRTDRVTLSQGSLAPTIEMSCSIGLGLELWSRHGLQAAATAHFGNRVERIEHAGIYNCRRLYNRNDGQWSEHSTGNAIDISAFVFEDGRRIRVIDAWRGAGAEATFLREARDSACRSFATVLSPDYNAAHADHFHLDQAMRDWGTVCR